MQSLAADSVGLAQKRREGGAYTRPKRYMSSPVPNYDDDDDDGGDSDIDSFKNVSESGLGFDDSDDSSLSLTPPSSDDENDGVVVTGAHFRRWLPLRMRCSPLLLQGTR